MTSTVPTHRVPYIVAHTLSNISTLLSPSRGDSKLVETGEDIRATMAIIQLIMGTFGNVLSFIIMQRTPLRLTSAGSYFAVLAIADTLYLYIGLVSYLIDHFTDVVMQQVHPWSCKIVRFTLFTSGDASVWLLVAVTVDRFIAVVIPTKGKVVCIPRRARIVSAIVWLAAITKNLHIFWTRGYEQITKTMSTNCGYPSKDYAYFEKYIRPWIALATLALIPGAVIFLLNVIIIWALRKQNQLHPKTKYKYSSRHQSGDKKYLTQMTAMFLGISFEYLILIPPCYILLIVRPYFDNGESPSIKFAQSIIFAIQYTHYAINFYMYCMTGKGFRKQVRHLFCGKTKTRLPETAMLSEVTQGQCSVKSNNSVVNGSSGNGTL